MAGLGISRLPQYLCEPYLCSGRLVDLMPDTESAGRDVVVISPRQRQRKTGTAALRMYLETAFSNPDSLVAGYPVFDVDIPRIRFYGRYLTHFWVCINTLSFAIRDTMCGFRVYPLVAVVAMLKQEKCGNRMDFDPEVIVRWYWRGGKVINLPTRVRYPTDGISHFDKWKDNLLISLMHARLFLGMLYRLPGMLWRRARG